jgi:hypothetical protein
MPIAIEITKTILIAVVLLVALAIKFKTIKMKQLKEYLKDERG